MYNFDCVDFRNPKWIKTSATNYPFSFLFKMHALQIVCPRKRTVQKKSLKAQCCHDEFITFLIKRAQCGLNIAHSKHFKFQLSNFNQIWSSHCFVLVLYSCVQHVYLNPSFFSAHVSIEFHALPKFRASMGNSRTLRLNHRSSKHHIGRVLSGLPPSQNQSVAFELFVAFDREIFQRLH